MSYDDEIWIEDEKEVCKIERLNENKSASKLRVDSLAKEGIQDLLLLSDLNEFNCLHNIRIRYLRKQIHTQIGFPILISINPYIFLPNIYNQETLANYRVKLGQYQKTLKRSIRENEFEPHLFKIAQLSLDQLFETPTKRIKNMFYDYIRRKWIRKNRINKNTFKIQQQNLKVVYLILFNMDKLLNNKYLFLILFLKHLVMLRLQEMIILVDLENLCIYNLIQILKKQVQLKQIIIYQKKVELLRQINKKEIITFFIKLQHHKYQNQKDLNLLNNMNIQMEDIYLLQEQKNLNLQKQINSQSKEIYLSNYSWIVISRDVKVEYDSKKSKLRLDDSLRLASYLQRIQIQKLEDLICKVITSVGKESVTINNNLENAQSARNTLAKHVYEKFFNWLIDKVFSNYQILNLQVLRINSILDIFGFEIFTDVNGLHNNNFEQQNINYTNENLQQQFNQQMFVTDKKNMTQNKLNFQIIKILQIQLKFHRFPYIKCQLIKLLYKIEEIKNFQILQNNYLKIIQYQQVICKKLKWNLDLIKNYIELLSLTGFVQNILLVLLLIIDSINSQVFQILPNSTNPVLKEIWSKIQYNNQQMKQNNVINKFQNSLKDQINLLNQSIPKYIRCIKPNNFKQPLTFDAQDVRRQITRAGLMEAIQIRKVGFEIRQKNFDFIRKYQHLVNKNPKNIENIKEMLKLLGGNQQIGQFLKKQSRLLGFKSERLNYL